MSPVLGRVASLALVVLMSGGLVLGAVGVVSAQAPPPPGVIVVGASASASVPADILPAFGAPCAETMKSLLAAKFKLINTQVGGGSLLYTLQKDAREDMVVIVLCTGDGRAASRAAE